VALDLAGGHLSGFAAVTFSSVLKPGAVLASSGDEFCNASTCLFAFNPGRITVLQFPRGSFCSWFSHEASAVSLCGSCRVCFQLRLAARIRLPDCWALLSKNHVTECTESKSRQEHALCVAGAAFLGNVFPLWTRAAAPGVRENTAPASSSGAPCLLWKPGQKGNGAGFSPQHCCSYSSSLWITEGCLPTAADTAKARRGVHLAAIDNRCPLKN